MERNGGKKSHSFIREERAQPGPSPRHSRLLDLARSRVAAGGRVQQEIWVLQAGNVLRPGGWKVGEFFC